MNTQTHTETQRNELKKLLLQLFENCTDFNNSLVAGIEADNRAKTKHIERVKDFCNNTFSLYCLNIVFIGGTSAKYQTAIKIELQ